MANKIIVAVHGIGDQGLYETVQSVAYRFCSYHNVPAAIPLGRLHSQLVQMAAQSQPSSTCALLREKQGSMQSAFIVNNPPDPGLPDSLGFAEIYWANYPRDVAKEGYTLEETKKWAKTIVERLRLNYAAYGSVDEKDFRVIDTVLEEMIDTLAILERLSFLAEKAGIFKFDLKPILVDYLGDVQVVAEFSNYRNQILKRFDDVLAMVARKNDQDEEPEIYIVAHSEGTVISFLTLMRALCRNWGDEQHWIRRIRGFMTIGSPIDVHMVLWPELLEEFEGEGKTCSLPDQGTIPWVNYLDNGDPIGYPINITERWMREKGWNVFNIENIRFSRYEFPGRAHIDYWKDEHVFGHFIKTVVKIDPPEAPAGQKKIDYEERPASRRWAQFISYVLPYALVFALFFAAVYVIYKATRTALTTPGSEQSGNVQRTTTAGSQEKAPGATIDNSSGSIFRDVAGLAFLLFGITILTRIPRLTRLWKWRFISLLIFLASAITYPFLVTDPTRQRLRAPIDELISGGANSSTLSFSGLVERASSKMTYEDVATLGLAILIIVIASWLSRERPRWGLKPLLITGGAIILSLVLFIVINEKDRGPVWPIFPATVGFLYMWWLAALVFDLTFIWHRYIRHAAVIARFDELCIKREEKQPIPRKAT